MKIVSWNVNGLRAVHRKGNWKDVLSLNPDILCLQEIKAQKEQLPDDVQEVDGFYSFFNSSKTKKGYSGTALYSRRKPMQVSFDIPDSLTEKHKFDAGEYEQVNREGRVITAEFPEMFVVTVYTPNSKGDLSRLELRHKHWDPAFLEYCVTLQNQKPVVFCGDLNVAHKPIDLAHPKENVGKINFTKEEREGVDNIIEEGFVDTLRVFNKNESQYTWWSPWSGARERNVGWRLDYCFASEQLEETLENATIHPQIFGSDHCPISANFVL